MRKLTIMMMAMMLTASMVMAMPGDDGYKKRGGKHRIFSLEKHQKHLKLSKAQLERIEVINEVFKEEHDAVREKIMPLKERLHDLKGDEDIDYVRVRRVLEDMAPLRIEMHLLRMKHKRKIEAELTETQRRKLKKMKAARKEKWKTKYRQSQKRHDG